MTPSADVRLLLDAVNTLDVDAIADLPLHDALTAFHVLEETNRVLAQVRSQLPNLIAPSMGEKQVVVEGIGTFVMHGKRNRTKWEKDDLLRAVLDTRITDPETGETESQLDKVLKVWNLGSPRTTALKALGLDPDDYCRSEWGGYSLEVLT